jgi:hypothetical protein
MLVDTSVWVSHFRFGNPTLGRVLNEGVSIATLLSLANWRVVT